jgi:hypothetical protein
MNSAQYGCQSARCWYLFLCLLLGSLLVSCGTTTHQTYWYATSPGFPLSSNHFVGQCKTSVSVLHTGESFPFLWKASPDFISNTPVVSASPVPIHITVALIGPYKGCGPFRGIVSQDFRQAILGPVALKLPIILTDDWSGKTFLQQLTLPERAGFYVLYEQRATQHEDGVPFNALSLEWIRVMKAQAGVRKGSRQ